MWGFHAHARKFLGFWNKYQSTIHPCWLQRGRHLYFGVWCNFDGCCCLDGGRYNFKQISQVFVHDQVCCIWDLSLTWTCAADLLDRQRDTNYSEHDCGCLLSRASDSCEYRFQRWVDFPSRWDSNYWIFTDDFISFRLLLLNLSAVSVWAYRSSGRTRSDRFLLSYRSDNFTVY